jgi:hypothetical protein
VRKNATTLDDGISSADVIASAAVQACAAEVDRAAETITYGPGTHATDIQMLEDLREKMRLRVGKDATSRATVAVLKHRAKARSK